MKLDEVVEQLRKKFGEGILMTLADKPTVVPVISTGSLAVDRALGIGGVPRGRITEIFGSESAGKTTLAQHIAAEAQKNGGQVVYIDMENKLDPTYMQACGIDASTLMLSQPPSGTAAFDIIRALLANDAVDLIIVDSVAALSASAELDADAGDQFMGVQARMMSQNLKVTMGTLGLSRTALVFINQIRMKIGVMYGNPETTPGGKALLFYASVRMRVSHVGNLGPKGKEYGIESKVKVVKNSLAAPFKQAEFEIVWGKGISREADVLNVAAETGVVVQKGSWYYYNDEAIGNGKEVAKGWLAAHPEQMAEIREKVLNAQDEAHAEP